MRGCAEVPRQPDLLRKPQLLEQIIECLLDRPLSSITFRVLADDLRVSSFTLVYHFGSKEVLVAEIVRAIRAAQSSAIDAADIGTSSVEHFFDGVRRYWEWTTSPRSRQLHRLEFEAAMFESLREGDAASRSSLAGWHDRVHQSLIDLGVPPGLAQPESRAMANVMYGLQYDLVVTGDTARVSEAFERATEAYHERIAGLIRSA